MKKWKTRRIWALVTAMVLLAALSLSACGSKSYNTAAWQRPWLRRICYGCGGRTDRRGLFGRKP